MTEQTTKTGPIAALYATVTIGDDDALELAELLGYTAEMFEALAYMAELEAGNLPAGDGRDHQEELATDRYDHADAARSWAGRLRAETLTPLYLRGPFRS
jgi:hypothetical protein